MGQEQAMRMLTSHQVNGLNEAIRIEVHDGPGAGGACHEYRLHLAEEFVRLSFQNGPIGEAGFNGITNEALLAVIEDRLLGFQSGEFACRENALALTKLQEAMMWLKKRTADRVARGVEGTHEK